MTINCSSCGGCVEYKAEPKWHEAFARYVQERQFSALCYRCSGTLHWDFIQRLEEEAEGRRGEANDLQGLLEEAESREREAEAEAEEWRAVARGVGAYSPQSLREALSARGA